MKDSWSDLKTTMVAVTLVTLLVIGATFCIVCSRSAQADGKGGNSIDKTVLDSFLDVNAYTFDDHGHLFLVAAAKVNGVSVIHHPGCPCFKQE